MKVLLTAILFLVLQGCASHNPTVYEQLGGRSKVTEIVDNFITQIEYDEVMFAYFEDSNITRFKEKMVEHICVITGGGCTYSGDSMERVHTGMNIPERDFNHAVDLLIAAMNDAQVPHRLQNKVLATMAPSRSEIIYR